MLNQAELEAAFKVHFDEMENCEQHKCYWALLHLVVILPDICGALQSDNGQASRQRYEDWCNQYLANDDISSEDWYSMRCGLLHQGTTLANKGRYASYSFSQPTPNGSVVHRIVSIQPSGDHLLLDVGKLKREVLIAVRKWFQGLERTADSAESRKVKEHLSSLVKENPTSTAPILGEGFYLNLPENRITSSWQGPSQSQT